MPKMPVSPEVLKKVEAILAIKATPKPSAEEPKPKAEERPQPKGVSRKAQAAGDAEADKASDKPPVKRRRLPNKQAA